jgi:hypothetical protein
MGRRCQVCDHPERAKIELGLARRVSATALARKFDIHHDAIYRHRKLHMPPQLKAALLAAGKPTDIDLDALRKSESEGLLQHIVAQRGKLYHLLDEAEGLGDLRAAAQVHGRIIENLQLGAKLLGELNTHAVTVTNNLVVSQEYLELRRVLHQALRPYPVARQAVARALAALETAATSDVQSLPGAIEANAINAGS